MKIFLLSVALLLFSCDAEMSKVDYINSYNSFISEVAKNKASYSDVDWNNADSLYTIYSVDYYKRFSNELTNEEKIEVNKMTGKYIGYRAIDFGSDISSEIDNALKEFGSQVEGIIETITEELNIDSL